MAGPRVLIFIGAYGSGKTETAINFACRERMRGGNVSLIDLDIVNPYFRSREAQGALAPCGLRVISSVAGFEDADLPSLSPAILGALQTDGLTLVIDAGGDPAGARALGRFHRLLTPLAPAVFVVVNSYRPETRTPEQIVRLVRSMEETSRQCATGLVANPNLGPETTAAAIAEGCGPIWEAAAMLGLTVAFTCVREDLVEAAGEAGLGPLLPLRRYMLLPWEAPAPAEDEPPG